MRSRAEFPAGTEGDPGVVSGADPEVGASRSARVVAFGGGTGMSALLSGLKRYTDRVTAVVTVTDNGGSSGRLRNDFDIAAPGDIRNCLVALADVDPLIARAFQYRFEEAEFKGHCFGNLFITVLTRLVGDFEQSIKELNRILRVKGRVIPASNSKVSLVAHHPDGSKSTGEVTISGSRKPIQRIELRPGPTPVSPEIREAVEEADLFLFGPGSLYTSVIPNLLLVGLMDAIERTGKPRVYVGNIMTQPGETDHYRLSHHVRALREHVGENFPDVVIAHDGRVPDDVAQRYRDQGSEPVVPDLEGSEEFRSVRVITGDLFAGANPSSGTRSARHDPERLARVIYEAFLAPGGREEQGSGPTTIDDRRARERESVSTHGTRALR